MIITARYIQNVHRSTENTEVEIAFLFKFRLQCFFSDDFKSYGQWFDTV